MINIILTNAEKAMLLLREFLSSCGYATMLADRYYCIFCGQRIEADDLNTPNEIHPPECFVGKARDICQSN